MILQRFRFFIEFLELISLIGLSYSSNNIIISMTICVEVRIFSQFYLLHEMLHNLGIKLLYFVFFRLSLIMNFNFH
jgi:DNA integrity scanning protein DisA with diadenylate cyclase activity